MRPSSYTMYVPLTETNQYLLVHGYTGAVDLVDAKVVEALKSYGPVRLRQFPRNGEVPESQPAAIRPFVSDETIERLKQRGYLTEKSPEEEENHLRRMAGTLRQQEQRGGAGFLFVPTYGCNLRCPYCFEKTLFRHGPDYDHHIRPGWQGRVMDKETVDRAYEALAQIEPDLRRVWYIELYGGEPLVRYTREVVEYILARGKELGYGNFRATTNGVELELFYDLLGTGPGQIGHLQITLDGAPEIHDRRRFLPGKTGTFERIARNITGALELGIAATVRVNVDKKNAEEVKQLAELFQEQGWNRFRGFNSYLANVILKEARTSPLRFATEFEMDEAVRQGEGEGPIPANDWGIRSKIAHVMRTGQVPPLRAHFCGAAVGMYLFDPFGDIYTCWELVGEQHAKVGRFVPALEWGDNLKLWRGRSAGEIPECRKCRYALFCGGGCPKWAYDASGSLMSPFCNGFEQTFLHSARLAVRDLEAARAAQPAPATSASVTMA